ncbi:MAG: hypothetical protein LC769_12695 [Chloroflexi bacterium]|nr:hypothetical protein [Chloroflexota bacterium]
MFSSMYRRTVVAVAASSVLALGVSAVPASAATHQRGLVNVSLTNINVPIGIAANVCDVQASVLAAGSLTGGPLGSCSAVSTPTA